MRIEKFASAVDILGVVSFLYIIVYSIIALRDTINTMNLILLLIGIGGLFIDSFTSFNILEKKVKKK